MSEQLYFMRIAFEVEIQSFVLMDNHFHLLLRTPRANLSEAMAIFMKETGRSITKASHRINHTYGQRHFRSIITNQHHYLHAYKYFYYNPVQAGICRRVEEYRYSTLRGLLGLERLLIPVAEDKILFSDVEGTLTWLNRAPEQAAWTAVRSGLRCNQFKLPLDRSTHKPNRLEFDTL